MRGLCFTYDSKTKTASGAYKTYNLSGWNVSVDNDSYMLECPKCENRMIMENYLLAIGTLGTRFCPYCGEKILNYLEMKCGED